MQEEELALLAASKKNRRAPEATLGVCPE